MKWDIKDLREDDHPYRVVIDGEERYRFASKEEAEQKIRAERLSKFLDWLCGTKGFGFTFAVKDSEIVVLDIESETQEVALAGLWWLPTMGWAGKPEPPYSQLKR